MNPPLLFFPATPRRHRKRSVQFGAPTPAIAPVLVSANYQDGSSTLILTFDIPVNIDGYDGTQITVDDGSIAMFHFNGTLGATLTGANEVTIELQALDPDESGQVLLNATGTTGIVATEGAAPWAGVTDWNLA